MNFIKASGSIFCKKLIEAREAINYILTQLIASFLGALLVFYINNDLMHVAPNVSYSSLQIILCELIFTFLLAVSYTHLRAHET